MREGVGCLRGGGQREKEQEEFWSVLLGIFSVEWKKESGRHMKQNKERKRKTNI